MPEHDLPSRLSLIGGLLAGIGASACCAGPLLVISLGFGGAWVSQLTALEPVRPLFIAASVVFFVVGFRRLYLQPAVCEPGQACATSSVRTRQRRVFWLVAMLSAAVVAFPWYAPWIL